MGLKQNLTDAVDGILGKTFDERNGQKIPTSEDVALGNGAVKLDATFLYADLAGSGLIAKVCPWDTTAKIIRAYLDCAVRIIRKEGGEIRSFDGDRVMGVFIGGSKRTAATRAAMTIQWATEELIQKKSAAKFKSVRENNVKIRQACGIDVGTTRAVRAGIRNNNDLIWIGRPPSFAAKLSDVREYPHTTFISASVYEELHSTLKVHHGVDMWERRTIVFAGESEIIYRTAYRWKPDD